MSRSVRKHQHVIFQPATPTSKSEKQAAMRIIRGSTFFSNQWGVISELAIAKKKGR